MHTPEHEDRDALFLRVGRLIATDPVLADGGWDGFALVVRYDDGDVDQRLSGFRYRDDAGVDAATPRNRALHAALDALRAATQVEGEAPWFACVVQLRRATGKLHVHFEYDDPAQWDITPSTLHAVAERARPIA